MGAINIYMSCQQGECQITRQHVFTLHTFLFIWRCSTKPTILDKPLVIFKDMFGPFEGALVFFEGLFAKEETFIDLKKLPVLIYFQINNKYLNKPFLIVWMIN